MGTQLLSRMSHGIRLSPFFLVVAVATALSGVPASAAAPPNKDSCKVQANKAGTIQQAIDRGCTTIRVNPGTYKENLVIEENVTVAIEAVSKGKNVILDAGGSRAVEIGEGAQVTLSGLSIRNGNAVTGGGILNRGSLTLLNTTIENSFAEYAGGAIFNDFGTVTLSNSLITNNVADSVGGGIFNNEGDVVLENSSVTNNEASFQGGGIFNNKGTVLLTDSLVTGNVAGFNGGGILNLGGVGSVEWFDTAVTGNFPDDFSN